jgi:hypothetical protein
VATRRDVGGDSVDEGDEGDRGEEDDKQQCTGSTWVATDWKSSCEGM